MAITRINLADGANLEFQLTIDGVRDAISEIRFVIESADYKLGFNGNYINNTLTIKIPSLENILTEGEKTCYLEVVADSKYFQPFKDTIDFIAPVRVESAPPLKKDVPDVVIQVTNTNVTTQVKNIQDQDFGKQCTENKYTLVESTTHIYAKNTDDQYVGIKNKQTGKFCFVEPVKFTHKIPLI